MRRGLELVVEMVHVVEPVGWMKRRVLSQWVAPAQEVAGRTGATGCPTVPSGTLGLGAGVAATASAGSVAARSWTAQACAPSQPVHKITKKVSD